MGGSSRSSTSTTNNAYDNRTFIDDRDFTRIETNDNREYDIDNSVTVENDYRYDIDNSVRNDIDYDIDNSVRTTVDDSYNTTNNIDRSVTVEGEGVYAADGSVVTTVGDGAVYAGGDVNITQNQTDLGAIEEAFDFTESAFTQVVNSFGDVIALERAESTAAISDLSNTIAVGGLVAGVSVAAIVAYLAWRK